VGIELHHPHVETRRNEGLNRRVTVGHEDVAIGRGDHIAGRLEMSLVVAALARDAKRISTLPRLTARSLAGPCCILGNRAIGDPDIAVTVDMQAVRKHKQSRADAFDRLAVLRSSWTMGA